jgi:hypothetical protein
MRLGIMAGMNRYKIGLMVFLFGLYPLYCTVVTAWIITNNIRPGTLPPAPQADGLSTRLGLGFIMTICFLPFAILYHWASEKLKGPRGPRDGENNFPSAH